MQAQQKKQSNMFDYSHFSNSVTQKQWAKIGLQRRGGVAVPLFSLYSKQSIGIGEFADLRLLIDWCVETGMSIIQLLPMNDMGFDFMPYDAKSTFALDSMHLRLTELRGADSTGFKADIEALKKEFPAGGKRVNYGVKAAKLKLLREIFEKSRVEDNPEFKKFAERNTFWLEEYALFQVLKDLNGMKGWEDWPEPVRCKNSAALSQVKKDQGLSLWFQKWLQWQCYEQFKEVKAYAESKKVFLMGDLPFLVSRDSADVWAHQDDFKLDRYSGAPPDLYFANGQRWGMPPYNWPAIEAKGYAYLVEKLLYAQNFYDFFRIDHAVGTFRIWTIALTEPEESAGLNGSFDPADEGTWEEHGRKLLGKMIESTDMLPCAEDLGTVPDCSYRVLEEFAIPGMEVQRWQRCWDEDGRFKGPETYRKNGLAVLSTHDMTHFSAWWHYEIGSVDAMLFETLCRDKGIDFEKVKEKLFNPEQSGCGRLRWRPELENESGMLAILNLSRDDAWDLADMFKNTFTEQVKFLEYLNVRQGGKEPDLAELLKRALIKASESASIFSIQLLHDWLSLGEVLKGDPAEYRINLPGTISDLNWSIVMPLSLEEMLELKQNKVIKDIHRKTDRI